MASLGNRRQISKVHVPFRFILLLLMSVLFILTISANSRLGINDLRIDTMRRGIARRQTTIIGTEHESWQSNEIIAQVAAEEEQTIIEAPRITLTNIPSGIPSHEPISTPAKKAAIFPLPLLRYDWTNLTLHSEQAKAMYAHQHNCSIPWIRYEFRPKVMGLGSELHVWSHGLDESMRSRGYRIRTHPPPSFHYLPKEKPYWGWLDHESCGDVYHTSQLDCYFPGAEPTCGVEQTTEWANRSLVETQAPCSPRSAVYETGLWRAASMEYLFSNV